MGLVSSGYNFNFCSDVSETHPTQAGFVSYVSSNFYVTLIKIFYELLNSKYLINLTTH